MKKFSKKILRGVLGILLILAAVTALPPFGVLIGILLHEQQDVESTSPVVTPEIVKLEISECASGLVPKVVQELIFSTYKRTPAISIAFALYFSNFVNHLKLLAELHHYVRDNDLRFNIPPITYRQPSSEHASEG
jgi:hypothetical protein